ncbi:MAG: hypothetical protein WBE37_16630 [Bryobacteraceae bacterium]
MKTLAVSSLLLLSSLAAFGQNASNVFDKAPPAIDEALRARVGQFYQAFVDGKFKQAYLLVADDSQDKFFELSKDEYKSFEIIRINYSENFTKAAVVTAVKSEWRFQGASTISKFPLTTNWEVIDGQWYWHYVRPTRVATPFSPSGFVPLAPETAGEQAAKPASAVPKDIAGAAQRILSEVSLDKSSVRLRSDETSRDVVHVRNGMPGAVSLKLDKPDIPGLKVTLEQTNLPAHQETTIRFEWSVDNAAKSKAQTMSGHPVVQLHILPTGQVFPISVAFENAPAAPQK